MSDVDRLEQQRDDLAGLVEQLGGPTIEASASLRLLTAALEERLAMLDERLDDARRSRVRVELHGLDTAPSAQTSAAIVIAITEALRQAVVDLLPGADDAEVADAAGVTLEHVGDDDGVWSVEMSSPARSLEQLLVTGDGEPALHLAVGQLATELATGEGERCAVLAEAVRGLPASLRLVFSTPSSEHEVELDRGTLQHARP